MLDDVIKFFEQYVYLIIGSVKAFVVAGALLGIVPALVWLERRLMGRFQVRLGPNRVGPFGLGQPISDSIKLLFKESIIQSSADKFLFHLAEYILP